MLNDCFPPDLTATPDRERRFKLETCRTAPAKSGSSTLAPRLNEQLGVSYRRLKRLGLLQSSHRMSSSSCAERPSIPRTKDDRWAAPTKNAPRK